MIKTEAEYRLETATEGLEKVVQELKVELNSLDPYAAYHARLKVAAIEGILMFMKEKS